ncbi:hypothetical protein [Aquimarina sp. 2304DJ70-9]|uniref:hypothetical protein n=1 Tax=Aquimarina penaris TaxID=3231044 RepID=UPI0034629A7B
MRIVIILITASFLIYSCKEVKSKNEVIEKVNAEVIDLKDPSYCNDIENTIGIVIVNKENFKDGDKLNILNEDLSVFKTSEMNEEYEISSYKCLSVNDSIYSITTEGGTKYIRKNDHLVSLQKWDEHLLNSIFSIGVDVEDNPIRETIKGKPILSKKSNNHRISPIEIKGDWMKVKHQDFNTEKTTEGWIKWRNEKCLVVEIFYFA